MGSAGRSIAAFAAGGSALPRLGATGRLESEGKDESREPGAGLGSAGAAGTAIGGGAVRAGEGRAANMTGRSSERSDSFTLSPSTPSSA